MDYTTIIVLVALVIFSFKIGEKAANKGRSFWGFFLLSMVVSPLLSNIIVNRISLKLPEDASQSVVQCEVPEIQKSVSDILPPIKYCRKCGFELIEGSEFCSRCGTKIIKE